jgi:hypothetical protein
MRRTENWRNHGEADKNVDIGNSRHGNNHKEIQRGGSHAGDHNAFGRLRQEGRSSSTTASAHAECADRVAVGESEYRR